MRVLLDSNVWLSILTSRRGFCRRLWPVMAKRCVVFSGEPVLREIEEKLTVKFRRPPRVAARLAGYVERKTRGVELERQPPAISRDADDDLILGLAFLARCEFLVTGDKDLLTLSVVNGLRIVTPRQFSEILDSIPS